MKSVVLYIDDDLENLKSFKYQFQAHYKIITATSPEEGYEVLKNNEIEVIIADQRMPNMTGTEFFQKILHEYPIPARLVLTGYSDINAVIEGINKGKIFHYLQKPWKEEEIKMVINNAINTVLLTRKNERLLQELHSANNELRKYQEHLEKLVKERTRALEEKNLELEKFVKLFEGREFKIKELKEKINDLEKKQQNEKI